MTRPGDTRPDDTTQGGDRLDGRLHGEQPETVPESLAMRLLSMVLIWLMLSIAQTVLTLATVLQVVLMLTGGGRKNDRLAEFGTDLGVWIAKAARYQTGASEVRPWPWTELD